MNQLKKCFSFIIGSIVLSSTSWAGSALSCIDIKSETGGWNGKLTLSNQCGKEIDLRNGLVEFQSNKALNGSFWGAFSPLAYPQNATLTSENNNGQYSVTIPLTFPEGSQWWKPNTLLPAGASIAIQFSTTPQTTIYQPTFYSFDSQSNLKKGQLNITFPPAPSLGSPSPSKVTISGNDGFNKVIANATWNKVVSITNLPYGNYHVLVDDLKNQNGQWSGIGIPANIEVNSEDAQTIKINYQQAVEYGQINVLLNQDAPEENLAMPIIKIKDLTENVMLPSQEINWSEQISVDKLIVGHQYEISSETLYGNKYKYIAKLHPTQIVIVTQAAQEQLTMNFEQQALPTAKLKMSILGVPNQKKAIITAMDNKGNQYSKEFTNGTNQVWNLPSERQYQLSSAMIESDGKKYNANLTPSNVLLQSDSNLPVTVAYQEKLTETAFSPYVDVTLGAVTKWDSATGSMQPIGLLDIAEKSGVKSFHLAFITARNGCQGTWNGYPVTQSASGYGVPVFKTLKERGIELRVALGGLSGTYLAQVCDSHESLYHAYETIINAYQPDVMDFDVENAMQTNNEQLDRMMIAIKTIQQNHPNIKISFTLPVLPSGLVKHVGYNVLKRAQHNGLDDYLVNIMAMDYGSSFQDKSMGEYAKDAATNTFKQLKALYPNQNDNVLWQRIGITPMLGLNDTIPLNFTLEDVDTLTQFASDKQVGLLSFWSITRDHPCSSQYVSITCSSINPKTNSPNQTLDFEYSKRFLNADF